MQAEQPDAANAHAVDNAFRLPVCGSLIQPMHPKP